ncbi:MAG: NAD(P)H-dependent glycerol-3-phosphate dehydrogenase [Rikenellaceae bacterium]|jgi:glycerol-3-phosphate dehydrogenase (NAD(P)+)|nr:NAD(P)H-dependent glycerol-3-phosphate dehydrogenase [Rikenellaceae bacterium]
MKYELESHSRVAVIGAGSWATAIVKIIQESGEPVGWYVREPEIREGLATEGRNPIYLQDVHFDRERLQVSGDINEVVAAADIIVLAVPSAFLKVTMEPLTVSLHDKFIVSAIKGIITDEYITVAEYINRAYSVPFDRIGIVSGPSHAEEVALERLTYLTVVCKAIENAERLAQKFRASYIRTIYSTDIYGTEYATVLKNIYAVAVGICHGLGYGDNFMAVLICNSAMEMERFMNETYPADRNLSASVYLGDLLVTCYSQFSRNRTFGMMIGKGYSVKNTMIEMTMVAEGYYSAACIQQINKKFGIRMPIAEAVYQILYKNASAQATIKSLTKELI